MYLFQIPFIVNDSENYWKYHTCGYCSKSESILLIIIIRNLTLFRIPKFDLYLLINEIGNPFCLVSCYMADLMGDMIAFASALL